MVVNNSQYTFKKKTHLDTLLGELNFLRERPLRFWASFILQAPGPFSASSAIVLSEIHITMTTVEPDCYREENYMEQCQQHKNLCDFTITKQFMLLDTRIRGLCLYFFWYLTFLVRSLIDQQKELRIIAENLPLVTAKVSFTFPMVLYWWQLALRERPNRTLSFLGSFQVDECHVHG